MRSDIYAIGEVKKKYSDDHKKDSYIKLASKVAFLLEAQDRCYATPGIQLLGNEIILTLFNHGGSISTHPLDIHQFPEVFLCILLGVTFADGTTLSFDPTCYAKATIAGRRLSEGGTHEEMLHPQDQEEELRGTRDRE